VVTLTHVGIKQKEYSVAADVVVNGDMIQWRYKNDRSR